MPQAQRLRDWLGQDHWRSPAEGASRHSCSRAGVERRTFERGGTACRLLSHRARSCRGAWARIARLSGDFDWHLSLPGRSRRAYRRRHGGLRNRLAAARDPERYLLLLRAGKRRASQSCVCGLGAGLEPISKLLTPSASPTSGHHSTNLKLLHESSSHGFARQRDHSLSCPLKIDMCLIKTFLKNNPMQSSVI